MKFDIARKARLTQPLPFIVLVIHFLLISASTSPEALPDSAPIAESNHSKSGPSEIYPDSSRTPGAPDKNVTQANIRDNICNTNWSTRSVRPASSVTSRIKTRTMKEYGFTGAEEHYELDHLISLQAGGCPDCLDNLWPEAYGDTKHEMTQNQRAAWNRNHPGSMSILPGALEKDMVESHIHDEICINIPDAKLSSLRKRFPPTVSIALARGQQILATDWYACYLNMINGNEPCK